MRTLSLIAAMMAVSFASPVTAQSIGSSVGTKRHLKGLTASEADALIGKLQGLQAQLARGETVNFDLLSGAPASYEATKISPRETFLQMSFDKPFSIEKMESHNPLWQPHRLTFQPGGPGQLVWDIELVLGIHGQVERIELFNRPPHPF